VDGILSYWTPVSEDLPTAFGISDELVLATDGEQIYIMLFDAQGRWRSLSDENVTPTHWMPLPWLPHRTDSDFLNPRAMPVPRHVNG
jgi:hypothetical protein